jgi:hypothetical protein
MTIVVNVLAGIGAWFLASLTTAAAWALWRYRRLPGAGAASPRPRGAASPTPASVPPSLAPPPEPPRHGGLATVTATRPCGCQWTLTGHGWVKTGTCDGELYRQLREMSR